MELPVMYGLTHDEAGVLTARVPRAVKIAIGKPKGKALHVLLSQMTDESVAWVLEIGSGKQTKQRPYKLEDIDLLKRDYQALRLAEDTPERNRPEALPYFTFFTEASDGTQVHDFATILKHGVRPRSIEVVFTDDQPFDPHYAFWSASELRCKGDGIDARRSINFTPTPEDKQAAAVARAANPRARTFPILDGCWTRGCPYAQVLKKGDKEYKQCGPTGSLSLQLWNDIRLGAKAEFTTTGYRSINQIAACMNELATFTGGGDPKRGTVRGIPLVMKMGQFRTNHNGVAGKAFAVRLEFRAGSVQALHAKYLESAEIFGRIPGIEAPQPKQLAAPAPDPAADPDGEDVTEAVHEAEYVDDETAFDGANSNAGFTEDGSEEIADTELKEDADATYAAAKAKLMAEAEAGAPPREMLPNPEHGITDDDLPAAFFDGQARTAEYVDPGEQAEPRRRRTNNVTFPK